MSKRAQADVVPCPECGYSLSVVDLASLPTLYRTRAGGVLVAQARPVRMTVEEISACKVEAGDAALVGVDCDQCGWAGSTDDLVRP